MKIKFDRLICIIGGIIFLVAAWVSYSKESSLVWANIIAAVLLFINGIIPSKKENAKK